MACDRGGRCARHYPPASVRDAQAPLRDLGGLPDPMSTVPVSSLGLRMPLRLAGHFANWSRRTAVFDAAFVGQPAAEVTDPKPASVADGVCSDQQFAGRREGTRATFRSIARLQHGGVREDEPGDRAGPALTRLGGWAGEEDDESHSNGGGRVRKWFAKNGWDPAGRVTSRRNSVVGGTGQSHLRTKRERRMRPGDLPAPLRRADDSPDDRWVAPSHLRNPAITRRVSVLYVVCLDRAYASAPESCAILILLLGRKYAWKR